MPDCFQKWLYQFTVPPTVDRNCSTCSKTCITLLVCWVWNGIWWWSPFSFSWLLMRLSTFSYFVGHSCLPFCEMSLMSFAHFSICYLSFSYWFIVILDIFCQFVTYFFFLDGAFLELKVLLLRSWIYQSFLYLFIPFVSVIRNPPLQRYHK